MTTVKIDIPDQQAAALSAKAAAQGLTLETWFQKMAERELPAQAQRDPAERSVVEQMRALRARVKPDPEGWGVKDYINFGRR